MDWQDFSQHLSETLNLPIHIETAHPISGGDIHFAYQLHTSTGNYFLKLNRAELLPLFATEAHSLQAIYHTNSIRCPKVLGYGSYYNQAWLLMEHFNLSDKGDDFARGRDLAQMHHKIHDNPKPFGWFEDNYIGHTLQQNHWHFEWVDFYGQQRLKPQLELAQLRGATSKLYQLGMELIEILPFWFQNYKPEASLLHGDLWGGNSAFTKDSSGTVDAVVYDPASYYGDREADIAMTELFGGYSAAFYDGYNSLFPLDSGYSSRKALYNLYHVLNHFNLFGGQYESQALSIIEQLIQVTKTKP